MSGGSTYLSLPDRLAKGKAVGAQVPRSVHGEWASLNPRSTWRRWRRARCGATPSSAGQALARAHARAGDAAAIAGYFGSGDALPRALAAFGEAYADQNQRDHEALRGAARTNGHADLPPDTPRPGARIAHRGERADLHAST